MSDVSRGEILRFGLWCAVLATAAVAATVFLVHRAEAVAPRDLDVSFLETLAIASSAAVLAWSMIGGFAILRPRAPWAVVLLSPLARGLTFGCSYYATLSWMGQLDPGATLCDAPNGNSCDTAYGLGAAALSVIVAAALLVPFVLGHVARRGLLREHRER
jgi:hypothetical protein